MIFCDISFIEGDMDGKLIRGETVLLHRKYDFLKYEMTTSSWGSMVRSEVYRTILIGFPMIIEGKHMYHTIIDEVHHICTCCRPRDLIDDILLGVHGGVRGV